MPQSPEPSWLEVETVRDVVVVRPTLRRILNEEKIAALTRQLQRLVADSGQSKFVLNLSAVESMASMMVAGLYAVHRKLTAAGGRMVLCGVQPGLREAFKILKLSDLVPIYDEEQDALLSLY